MAVPNQTPYTIFTANGITTVFPYEFLIFNVSDLAVSINGTVITSGYTVAGAGNISGGTVVFLTPPAAGTVVMNARNMPLARQTEYQDNGDLLAATVNQDFDRIWMVLQGQALDQSLALRRPWFNYDYYKGYGYRITEIADPVSTQDVATKNYVDTTAIGRTLRVPESFIPELPNAGLRANRIQGYDSVGSPIMLLPESGSAADVLIDLASTADGKGDSLVGVKQPFTGAVGTTQHNKNKEIPSSADFGVTSSDSTAIFTDLKAKNLSVKITEDTISTSTNIEGVIHYSHKEVNQVGNGRVPIVNLSKSNILSDPSDGLNRYGTPVIVTTGYVLKNFERNILMNGGFTTYQPGFSTSIPANSNAPIGAVGWRLETAGNPTSVSNVAPMDNCGFSFKANYESLSSANRGYVYIRQYINTVQLFSSGTFTTTIDVESDQTFGIETYIRMRINGVNEDAGRPLASGSKNISLPAGRHKVAVTFICPDVESFRGTENDLNGLEFAWRVTRDTVGITNYKIRSIALVGGIEIPHPNIPSTYLDSLLANVMSEYGEYAIRGLSATAGQRQVHVSFRATKYRIPSIRISSLTDVSNRISTYNADGAANHSDSLFTVSNITTTGFDLGLSDVAGGTLSNTKTTGGIAFKYFANAFW